MSAALDTVYNHYMSSYAPKSLTRFDAHKESELRSIYNSMVRLNKDAPWYLPTTRRDIYAYAVGLKENARSLHNTLAQLGGLEENGLLNKRKAGSSNEDLITAAYIGPQDTGSTPPQFDIEVKALASRQENMGLFLSDTRTGLAPDTYSFDISINDMNYEFQFVIGDSETNREIQARLARLISSSGIGVKASLAESEGKTSLVLTSEATGVPQRNTQIFEVSDSHTSKTSGTVAYFGLDYVSRKPSNAELLINGEELRSVSNHLSLAGLFEIQLKGVTSGSPVRIGLKTDVESLADNITQLIDGYNTFVEDVSSYTDAQFKSKQLVHEFEGIASVYNNPMEAMGITVSEKGTLTVDRDLLQETAAGSRDITDTFSCIKGFSSLLLRKSSQICLNPMDYVEKTIVAYKNPGRSFISPYFPGAYSGMMFSSYC